MKLHRDQKAQKQGDNELRTLPAEVNLLDAVIERIATGISERLARCNEVPDSMSFGELFELYYKQHVLPRTRCPENADYFYRYHGPRWQDVPVNRITKQELQQWVDELGIRSQSSATRALDMMSAIINWGIRRDHISCSNPCKGVERFKLKARERFLLPEEFAAFTTALQAEPQILQDFFWMCLLTGARRGNIEAMKWSDIDLSLEIWQFDNKNGDRHCVPLTKDAVEILRRRQSKKRKSEWVFPSPKSETGHLVEPKRAIKRVIERAGITDLRIHDLRRTVGSYLAIQGESSYIIGQMLGHKDQRSTAVYARLNIDPVRKAAQRMQSAWAGLNSAKQPQKKQKNRKTAKSARLEGIDQVIVEGKILSAIRQGTRTKKGFYSKIGSSPSINKHEMDRILEELADRGLIECYRDESSKDWHYWSYRLVN